MDICNGDEIKLRRQTFNQVIYSIIGLIKKIYCKDEFIFS